MEVSLYRVELSNGSPIIFPVFNDRKFKTEVDARDAIARVTNETPATYIGCLDQKAMWLVTFNQIQ